MNAMKRLAITSSLLFASLFFSSLLSAQPAKLHLLVSNGFKGSMEALHSSAEKAAGRPLDVQFSSTAALKKRIEGGETFDATIITVAAITDLTGQKKITAGSQIELGTSELGIGIHKGARRPVITSTEALKQALTNAKSITYPKDGATRGYLEDIFSKLGIAAALKPKIFLADGSGAATESVAQGKSEMVLTLFSEIVPVQDLEILGGLPAPYKFELRFAGAASTTTANKEAVRKLLEFLASAQAAPVLNKMGIAPLKAAKAATR
jgi:molybdate transport system substrate-binding protein